MMEIIDLSEIVDEIVDAAGRVGYRRAFGDSAARSHEIIVKDKQAILTAFVEMRNAPEFYANPAISEAIALKEIHKETWRTEPESYWFARLVQEVGELGSSLVGDHEHPPEWELKQIAAICLNWLEMRGLKGGE